MAFASRSTALPSHIRSNSALGGSAQSTALQARINDKKLELESLKQLRDLSAGLAEQMQQLEDKLSMLTNGTEAVAAVLEKWHTVLRAISMASAHLSVPKQPDDPTTRPELPQPLVRIPIQEAQAALAQKEAEKTEVQSGG